MSIYNDTVFLQIGKSRYSNLEEFFVKNRNLIFGVLRAASLIAQFVAEIQFKRKFDSTQIKKFKLDEKKINGIMVIANP